MREDGEISILGYWSEDSRDQPTATKQPDGKSPNFEPEWAQARRRVGLYLEALCVPTEQRPLLTDRAMALAWNKTDSHGSIMAAAMSALHHVLEEAAPNGQVPVPAGRAPLASPLTQQRAMVPDSRAFPTIDRSAMTPTAAAFNLSLKTSLAEDSSSDALALRYVFPPGLEQFFF